MKSVNELLSEFQGLNGHLSVSVKDGRVAFQGTPAAFRAIASILMAQAENKGNSATACETVLKKGDSATGYMLTADSVSSLHFHCHQVFAPQ